MVKEEKVYWQLFKNIFIISACTFGGGFVIVGMIKEKFAEKLHWISEEEILDMAAIAQSAPGPLGVNMAVITGYRIRKVPGAFVCALGSSTSATYHHFGHLCILSAIPGQSGDCPCASGNAGRGGSSHFSRSNRHGGRHF